MDFDPDITAMGGGEWLFEYVLRQPFPEDQLATILLRLPALPAPASPRLQKTFHLRRIIAKVVSPKGLTFRTLQCLEQIEDIDRETYHRPPSPAMTKAYRLLALHLTIPHPTPLFDDDADGDDEAAATERYIESILLDWKSRISELGTSGTSSLFSQGLTEARRTMEACIANPFPNLFRLLRRREKGGTSKAARKAATAYAQEALAEMGPPAFVTALSSSFEEDDTVPTGENRGVVSGSGGSEDGPDHRHSMPEVSEPQEHNVGEDDHPGPGRSKDEPSHHDSMPEVVEPHELNGAEDDHPNSMAAFVVVGSQANVEPHEHLEEACPGDNNVVGDDHPNTVPLPAVGVIDLQSTCLSKKPNKRNPNRREIQTRKRPRVSYISREKKRKPWSAKEEETLREACMKYGEGEWRLIKDIYPLIFVERTVVNLKDKWRNMKEKEKKEKEEVKVKVKEKEKGNKNKNKKRRRT